MRYGDRMAGATRVLGSRAARDDSVDLSRSSSSAARVPRSRGRTLARARVVGTVLLLLAIAFGSGGCGPRAEPQAAFRQLTAPFDGTSRRCLPFTQQPSFSFGWLNRGGPVSRTDDVHRVTATVHAVDVSPQSVAEELDAYLVSMGFLAVDGSASGYRRADGEAVDVHVRGVTGQTTVSAIADLEVTRPGRFSEGARCRPKRSEEERP